MGESRQETGDRRHLVCSSLQSRESGVISKYLDLKTDYLNRQAKNNESSFHTLLKRK